MENQKSLKTKIKTLFLAIIAILSIGLPVSVSASSLCDKMSSSTGGFLSCNQDVVSFTEFQGGLSAPSATGYQGNIATQTDARKLIVSIVNYALGFLGLLAVIVIIYGGFMYVTSMGKEEQSGTGKKAITYAVIGIIIILMSFAIVNTVLQAGGGNSSTNGAAPGGTTNGDQNANRQALFTYAGTVVQTVARDFVTAYENYDQINIDITTLAQTDQEQSVKSAGDLKALLTNTADGIYLSNNALTDPARFR